MDEVSLLLPVVLSVASKLQQHGNILLDIGFCSPICLLGTQYCLYVELLFLLYRHVLGTIALCPCDIPPTPHGARETSTVGPRPVQGREWPGVRRNHGEVHRPAVHLQARVHVRLLGTHQRVHIKPKCRGEEGGAAGEGGARGGGGGVGPAQGGQAEERASAGARPQEPRGLRIAALAGLAATAGQSQVWLGGPGQVRVSCSGRVPVVTAVSVRGGATPIQGGSGRVRREA